MALILVINLGSTSTKTAIYSDEKMLLEQTLYHDAQELLSVGSIYNQYDLRRKALEEWIAQNGYDKNDFAAAAVRGGFTHPIEGGVWVVNRDMLDDLASGKYGLHVVNLGPRLAFDLFEGRDVPCYIVDSSVTDEFEEIARFSGYPDIPRQCTIHALNQRVAARAAAEELGKPYEECNFIVSHLGGGISVAVHRHGRIVDSNDGLRGDGPFSPERGGGVAAQPFAELCFSGRYTLEQVKKLVTGAGGMVAYTGSNDMRQILQQAESDPHTALLVEAMCYQISKEICSYAAVLCGKLDGVILTGGLAHSEQITNLIRERTEWMAPVFLYPGEDENGALAKGVLRVLRGKENVHIYHK